jgi:hypothetical protein
VVTLPTVFVDRSLGRVQVPELLRAAGVELVTLAEHYGMPADERVADATWIAESAQRGWIAFYEGLCDQTQAGRGGGDPRQRCAVLCLPNANLRAAAMAQPYVDNVERIARACAQPRPFLYTVQVDRLVPG